MKFSEEDLKFFFRIIEVLRRVKEDKLADRFFEWIDKHEDE